MQNKYTDERNIQMLIYLLKANNIKKIIVNPGTMNMSLVVSLQNDDFFELYSCVDERSAGYMACGLAEESGEPVVLTCTGATASRNYMPGITEAFYRKLPVLAIASSPHLGNIGQNIPQMLDLRVNMNDTYKYTTYISPIKSSDDEWANNVSINTAILELKRDGGGPVLLVLGTEVTRNFDVQELPRFRKIDRVTYGDNLPKIDKDTKIAIYVGNHSVWSKELEKYVDLFCEKYNAVVLCDHTSNYVGKYKILFNLICDQDKYESANNDFDILIHIGNTSGAYMKIKTKNVWRVNVDGNIRDTFRKLKYVFEMDEKYFFKSYVELATNKANTTLYQTIKSEDKELRELLKNKEFPYSNIWVASELAKRIPEKSVVHLAILNSLRSWNYFETNQNIRFYSNTGGFGIDGMLSTLIGASFNDPKTIYYGITGDLAFFYDINALGNRYVKNNIRIILINNGGGVEFHNYSHPVSVIGDENIGKFVSADGHFGNKSKNAVKDYVESLGFEYMSASSKKEFSKNSERFLSKKLTDKPIVFEIFTNSDEESDALKMIRETKVSADKVIKDNIKKIVPKGAKKVLKRIMNK